MNPNCYNLLLRLTQSPTNPNFSHIDFETPWSDEEWLIYLLFLDVKTIWYNTGGTIDPIPMISDVLISPKEGIQLSKKCIKTELECRINLLIEMLNSQIHLAYGLNSKIFRLSQKFFADDKTKQYEYELANDFFTTNKEFTKDELTDITTITINNNNKGANVNNFMCAMFYAVRYYIRHPKKNLKNIMIKKLQDSISNPMLNVYNESRLHAYLRILEKLPDKRKVIIAQL